MVIMSLRRCRKDIALLSILVGLIISVVTSLCYFIVTSQLVYALASVVFGLLFVIQGLVGYYFDVFGTKYELWRTISEYWTRKKLKQNDNSKSSNS